MTPEDVRHHVRTYVRVFAALLVLTMVTVALSYAHPPVHLAIVLALAVAVVKAGLVAAYFMHLVSERRVIYGTLVLAAVFFAALVALPVFGYVDQVRLP